MRKTLLLSVMFLPFAAQAQTFQAPAPSQQVAPAPAANAPAPAAPAAVLQQNSNVQVPRGDKAKSNLPKIDFCNSTQAKGLFRLMNVYETPASSERQALVDFPVQFLWLNKEGIYSEVKSKTMFQKRKQVIDAAKTEARKNMQQFVVTDDKGVLYVYKDQKAVTSYYCGIVKKEQGPYKKGDMILTPTQRKSGSLYKHYKRATIR